MFTIRNIILLLTAVLLASGTAIFVKSWLEAERDALAERPQNVQVIETPAVEVLVAAKDLTAGAFLKPEVVDWQPWPEDGVHENHIVRRPDEDDGKELDPVVSLEGAVVRSNLKSGEPVTKARIVHPGERGFLAAVLEPGFRAISVPVDATSGIAGFIFPGDWVDVMMTMQLRDEREGARQQRYFAQTVLERIRVLAVDQAVDLEDGEPSVAKTATIEVTPKEAERIAVSLEMGRLALSLNSLSSLEGEEAQKARLVSEAIDGGSRDPLKVRNTQRSYTLDSDVYHMLGDARMFPQQSRTRRVNVVRGSEADVQTF